jgi:hypothetical protein
MQQIQLLASRVAAALLPGAQRGRNKDRGTKLDKSSLILAVVFYFTER